MFFIRGISTTCKPNGPSRPLIGYISKNITPKMFYEVPNCLYDKTENEMDGACSADGEGKDVYRVLRRKPERKRPLGRPTCRWEDNIKMDLQKVG
jgi:hypothetical protein